MISRRAAGKVLMTAFAAIVIPAVAFAQDDYPDKDVKVIVPFAAGGGTDLVTRVFAQQLGEKYKKTFFVENRAGGGGGSVGGLALARSAPDGYTIGAGTSSGIQTAAIDPTEYNPIRDLEPIARFGGTTIVLTVNPSLPVNTIAELVEYAKSHPNLAYGSAGIGTANHFTGEMLAQAADIKLNHIPYRGEGPALQDVLAGQIPFMFGSLAQSKSHIKSGALKALAVTSERRSSDLPDVPTMIEAGFKDFVVDAWYGLYAPKGTPKATIEKLAQDVNKIRADPAISGKLMEQLSFDTSGSDSPDGFKTFMEAELAKYGAIAKTAGLTKQ
jgi:tripartite-type tricarboxylate transporter receptor subunit TctC